MLFNSLTFCLGFLPPVLIGFFLIGALKPGRWPRLWLIAASAIFYGWWSWKYLILLLVLTAFNFVSAVSISRFRSKESKASAKNLLIIAIAINLLALGYFKYANFFLANFALASGIMFTSLHIILPLGISFFTFQKIAYLVDAYTGKVDEFKFENFNLFVLFFPQLISGPIVHHSEFIPQIRNQSFGKFGTNELALGLATFIIGMFKKIIIADSCGVISDQIFGATANNGLPTFFEGWTAALAYTFQIYFDFSGYTDMAIGLALMFGIRLPENFASPYRSTSIVEFWRRWHMTLSRFLREYVYIPLGGNRKGAARRHLNLMVAMLLGGLWHGASWTFVIWGGLHGGFLIINHLWSNAIAPRFSRITGSQPYRFLAWLLTFLCVVISWVLFRSQTFEDSFRMLAGMAGRNGFALPSALIHALGLAPARFSGTAITALFGNGAELELSTAWSTLIFAFLVAIFGTQRQKLSYRQLWLIVFLVSGFVIQALAVGNRTQQFIYFQF